MCPHATRPEVSWRSWGWFTRPWQEFGTGMASGLSGIVASHRWLARYRFGPLEWASRWLTYGCRPPMRNAPSGA